MKGATIARERPAVHAERFSAAQIRPALRCALECASDGLTEPLLMALVQPIDARPLSGMMAATSCAHNSTLRSKTRSALIRMGAVCDEETRRWRLP